MSSQGFCTYSTRGTGILPSTTCPSRRAPRRRTYPRSRPLTRPPMRPPRDRQGPAPSSREGRGKPAFKDAGPGKRARPPVPQGRGPLGGTWKGRRVAWIAGEAGQGLREERAKTATSAPVNERRSTVETRARDPATPARSLSRRRVSKRGGLPLGARVSAPRVGGPWRRNAMGLTLRVRHCPLFLAVVKTLCTSCAGHVRLVAF